MKVRYDSVKIDHRVNKIFLFREGEVLGYLAISPKTINPSEGVENIRVRGECDEKDIKK